MSFLFKKKEPSSGGSTPVKDDAFADHSSSSSSASSASSQSHSAATQQRSAVLSASSAPPSPAMPSPSDMVYSPQQPLRQPLMTDQSTASTASHSSGSTPMSTSPISSPSSLHSSHHAHNNQQQQQSAYYQQVPTLHAATSPNSVQQQQPMYGQSQHVQSLPGFSPHQPHTNLVPVVVAQPVLATATTLQHSSQAPSVPIAVPIATPSTVSIAFPAPSSSSASSSSSSMSTSQPSSPSHSNRESPSTSIDQMQSMAVFEEKQSEDTLILRAHFAALPHLSRTIFHVGDTLGTGTFGRVRLVSYLQPSLSPKPLHFALKMLKKSEIIRLKQVEHIKAEKSILSRICHPFIVNLFAHFQDERYLYMCMESGECTTHTPLHGAAAPPQGLTD